MAWKRVLRKAWQKSLREENQRIYNYIDAGHSYKEAAAEFGLTRRA